MQDFQGTKFVQMGESGPAIVWGHGWGQSHAGFLDLCTPLRSLGRHYLLDFKGFGESDMPPEDWGTGDYADEIAALIRTQSKEPVIWIGHSFGCRVGVQLAARYPDLIQGLVLIAGAGLPRKRPLWQKLYFKIRIATYKGLKKLIPFGLPEDWLMKKFASTDYKSAGALRQVFVRVVNENLSELAQSITCPTCLIYGENDTETPPEIGRRYSGLIQGSEFVLLKGQDHYSVLSSGRHQVTKLLKTFIQTINDIKKD